TAKDGYAKADLIFKIRPLQIDETALINKNAIILSLFEGYVDAKRNAAIAKTGATVFGLELVPRISRAQSMDVLSSQSNLAGYRAVIEGAYEFGRAFPMMMTAAGTIPPTKVLVMGAGVAGLQAIATAKRLGAIVSATDVRPAAKEQVESLGGKFVAVEDEEFKQAETDGGYAKAMSAAYQAKQQALIAETIRTMDIVITTALIPGRKAPELVSAEMVASMKSGSVIVDMAVEQGGNCALSKPDEIVKANDVSIIGHSNMPGRLPKDASSLFARNLLNFVGLLWDKEAGELKINKDDEIIAGSLVAEAGQLVHPSVTS
ncbi:MAG: NAD(P) transhydrogenase subunit alpha, partial [Candidatus Puniceispirillum sp.]